MLDVWSREAALVNSSIHHYSIRVYTVQSILFLSSNRKYASWRIIYLASFSSAKHFRWLIPSVILWEFMVQQRFCESVSSTQLEKMRLGTSVYGRFSCQGSSRWPGLSSSRGIWTPTSWTVTGTTAWTKELSWPERALTSLFLSASLCFWYSGFLSTYWQFPRQILG